MITILGIMLAMSIGAFGVAIMLGGEWYGLFLIIAGITAIWIFYELERSGK